MSSYVTLVCNECGISQDAPDKTQHYVSLYVIVDDTDVGPSPRLKLDFCSPSCRQIFMDKHHT